jgi:hypothetical protein
LDRWAKLYRKLQAAESEREARERDVAEKRAAFDHWCRTATEAALQAVVNGLRSRGTEFTAHTGLAVSVEPPSRPPVQMGQGGPSMSFVRVALGSARVDLYSHQEPGALPILHVVRGHVEAETHAGRHAEVILSVPLCVVVQRPDDGWDLRRTGSSGQIDMNAPVIDVDELVYDLFETLVDLRAR